MICGSMDSGDWAFHGLFASRAGWKAAVPGRAPRSGRVGASRGHQSALGNPIEWGHRSRIHEILPIPGISNLRFRGVRESGSPANHLESLQPACHPRAPRCGFATRPQGGGKIRAIAEVSGNAAGSRFTVVIPPEKPFWTGWKTPLNFRALPSNI